MVQLITVSPRLAHFILINLSRAQRETRRRLRQHRVRLHIDRVNIEYSKYCKKTLTESTPIETLH
jgi:hypothetical protein